MLSLQNADTGKSGFYFRMFLGLCFKKYQQITPLFAKYIACRYDTSRKQ